MTIDAGVVGGLLHARLELWGEVFSTEELSRVGERYARCGGEHHWDVREYARHAGVGAREYRVVRGMGASDVYRSPERARAVAVGAALNDLESEERIRGLRGPSPSRPAPPR
jgi:hypothetical protein